MESDLENLRSKLSGLAGMALDGDFVADLLAEIVSGGGGVHIEIDDATRYRLLRRDGRFQLSREPVRNKPSSFPPRK